MTAEMLTSEPGTLAGENTERFEEKTLNDLPDRELLALIREWNAARSKRMTALQFDISVSSHSFNGRELMAKIKGRLRGDEVPESEKGEVDYAVDIFLEYCAENGIGFTIEKRSKATSLSQAA